MVKIGLVLSGGGARGIAHLGLLKVLDELGIKPYAISGVSAGAFIGALYAAGKTPDEILVLAKNNSLFSFSNLQWRKEGLFSMEPIQKIFLEHIPDDSFESLKIPLFVNATDFTDNKTVFFSEGKLIECLLASASVPLLFGPVGRDNILMVDGGLLNNLPVEPLVNICDKLIGSHVNKLKDLANGGLKLSKTAIIERCFHISIANSVYSKAAQCNLFIEPDLHEYGMFDVKQADRIFEAGYHAALKQKEKLIGLLGSNGT